jgi:hypothetical protein
MKAEYIVVMLRGLKLRATILLLFGHSDYEQTGEMLQHSGTQPQEHLTGVTPASNC